MNEIKRTYSCPYIEKVLMDNDISLALESPWGDPAVFGAMETPPELPMETLTPGL